MCGGLNVMDIGMDRKLNLRKKHNKQIDSKVLFAVAVIFPPYKSTKCLKKLLL